MNVRLRFEVHKKVKPEYTVFLHQYQEHSPHNAKNNIATGILLTMVCSLEDFKSSQARRWPSASLGERNQSQMSCGSESGIDMGPECRLRGGAAPSPPLLSRASSRGDGGGGGGGGGGGTRRSAAHATPLHGSRRPCCFCWCCCCSCSCLAVRNTEDNNSKNGDQNVLDLLLCDGEPIPSLEEIRSWGENFDSLMKNTVGRRVFRDFLRCEYSEENILFWLACEDLKKETSQAQIEEKARCIYDAYISILSPKEVSLDSRVRELVNTNMKQPSPCTFDEAQLQIYTLMHRDSYPRFVNSITYKKLAQLDNGNGGSAVGGGGGGVGSGSNSGSGAGTPPSAAARNDNA